MFVFPNVSRENNYVLEAMENPRPPLRAFSHRSVELVVRYHRSSIRVTCYPTASILYILGTNEILGVCTYSDVRIVHSYVCTSRFYIRRGTQK